MMKRALIVLDSDNDEEDHRLSHATKAPRLHGTQAHPINLDDSDDDIRRIPNIRPDVRDQMLQPPARQPSPDLGMFAPLEQFNPDEFMNDYWNDLDFAYDRQGPVDGLDAFDEFEADGGIPLIDQLEADRQRNGPQSPEPYHRGYRLHRSPTPHHHGHSSSDSPHRRLNRHRRPSPIPSLPENVNEDECLARTLEMFPDISHEYVVKAHTECDGRIQQVLDKIIDEPNYPKQRDRAKGKEPVKRESTAEAEEKRFMQQDRETAKGKMRSALLEVLKDEFPKIPVFYIQKTQHEKTHLYPTYMALIEAQSMEKPPYGKAPWRIIRSIDFSTITRRYGEATAQLEEELSAARKARCKWEAVRRREAAWKRDEEANVERAKAVGEVAECATCFDESPLNRMIHCNGEDSHFTCFECAATYIASEVGQSRCRITCPDSSGCNGKFTDVQLQLVPDQRLVEKLLKLQQEQDVRDAGVNDVVDCPFCDYKQVCPPVDIDFEFRCQKPECGLISCRKCQQHTHVPLTCVEVAKSRSKDVALEQRHKIEEAMTAALVRNCNRCKKPFVKEMGCNKMQCPSCKNLQCYVCSQTVVDYNHFHKQPGCPLHDNVEERHAQEVKKAEAEARAKIEAENPLVSKEGLEFQVSAAVKKDEEAAEKRRRQLGAVAGGGPAGLENYAAIYGNDALDDDGARRQRDRQLLVQQRALQQQIDLQRRLAVGMRPNRPQPAEPNEDPGVPPIVGAGGRMAHLDQQLADLRRQMLDANDQLVRGNEEARLARRQNAPPAPEVGRAADVRTLNRMHRLNALFAGDPVPLHLQILQEANRRRQRNAAAAAAAIPNPLRYGLFAENDIMPRNPFRNDFNAAANDAFLPGFPAAQNNALHQGFNYLRRPGHPDHPDFDRVNQPAVPAAPDAVNGVLRHPPPDDHFNVF